MKQRAAVVVFVIFACRAGFRHGALSGWLLFAKRQQPRIVRAIVCACVCIYVFCRRDLGRDFSPFSVSGTQPCLLFHFARRVRLCGCRRFGARFHLYHLLVVQTFYIFFSSLQYSCVPLLLMMDVALAGVYSFVSLAPPSARSRGRMQTLSTGCHRMRHTKNACERESRIACLLSFCHKSKGSQQWAIRPHFAPIHLYTYIHCQCRTAYIERAWRLARARGESEGTGGSLQHWNVKYLWRIQNSTRKQFDFYLPIRRF